VRANALFRPHDLRSHSPSVHHPSLIVQCSFAMNGMSPPQVPPDAGISPQSWVPTNRNSDFTDGVATSATTPSNTGSSEQRTPPAKRRRDERERSRVSRACDRCKKCVESFLIVLVQITEFGYPNFLIYVKVLTIPQKEDAVHRSLSMYTLSQSWPVLRVHCAVHSRQIAFRPG
jgi:hypothetical protein